MNRQIEEILINAKYGRAITKEEAVFLLSLDENSLEAALLRSTANTVSRERFHNNGYHFGQIGVAMSSCTANCSFCFYADAYTQIEPSTVSVDETISRCERFAVGGSQGVYLISMHHMDFDWYLNLCATVRKRIPDNLELLANVGDISLQQWRELKAAGITGAYHASRIREGIDTRLKPKQRIKTIENMLEAGIDWYNLCEPVGPEHSPEELAEQIWIGVEMPCVQHGALQRFPVPGSPLYSKGMISLQRLGQIVAVIALATLNKKEMKYISVMLSSHVGLFSGANVIYSETGEPLISNKANDNSAAGFTSAQWRQSNEITTYDCRQMLTSAGFSNI
ncbi:MAG: hypothetical protein JXR91_04065 [Deltaproteobacteria bacterium]|nr:hypothetical protein [Deltaproteobacteria bacterium]